MFSLWVLVRFSAPELSFFQIQISDSHYDPSYGLLPSYHLRGHQRFTRFLEESFRDFERDNKQQYAMVGGITGDIIDWHELYLFL